MQEIITNGLMTFAAGFTTAAISKAQGPGRALDDIMTLVGFEKLHEVAEKNRAKRDLNIQKYKESIAQKIAKIPEKNIQEPPLSIVGPALEASKYYIEEDTLREMFSNLIVSSMDIAKEQAAHPSYVELIKQMTPLDAQNIESISNYLSESPIAKILLHNSNGSYHEIFTNLYLGNPNQQDQDLIGPSLDNLERLGLINLDYTVYKYAEDSYVDFTKTSEYELAKFSVEVARTHSKVMEVIETFEEKVELLQKNNPQEASKLQLQIDHLYAQTIGKDKLKRMELIKGAAIMTSYGKNFCKTCLPD